MKNSIDLFVTTMKKLFASLFQFHQVGKRTLSYGGVACAEHDRALCVCCSVCSFRNGYSYGIRRVALAIPT